MWNALDETERERFTAQAAKAAKEYTMDVHKFYARTPGEATEGEAALERWVAKRLSLNARLTMRRVVEAIVEGRAPCSALPAEEAVPEEDSARASAHGARRKGRRSAA